MSRTYRGPKKQAVQLTSLLDLLFVMIFVSLIQQKEIVPKKAKPKKQKKTVAKVKVVAPKKVKPKPVPKAPVKYSISATFNFYATNATPNIPNGKYLMQGTFDSKNGKLKLGGVGWIQRPKHYDMVPLSGVIDTKKDLFSGRIEFIGCKLFNLTRKIKGSKTPISGQWIGQYDCTQGATGLTLTID